MIQYINKKDIYGPFMKRQDVYLPHSAEVTSDKFTNMWVNISFTQDDVILSDSHFNYNWWFDDVILTDSQFNCNWWFDDDCRRYQDKSSAKHNLDDFLKSAYAKQMKELNGTTGMEKFFSSPFKMICFNKSTQNTFYPFNTSLCEPYKPILNPTTSPQPRLWTRECEVTWTTPSWHPPGPRGWSGTTMSRWSTGWCSRRSWIFLPSSNNVNYNPDWDLDRH